MAPPARRAAALLAAGAALAAAQPAAAKGPPEHVRMYKVVAGECAQAAVPSRFQGAAAALSGLAPGACREQGFDEVEGSKTVAVPVLGQVTFELYRKADLLGLAAGVGAQALGLQGTSPCCQSCAPPRVRHYSVDAARNRCREVCAPSSGAGFWLLLAADPSLKRAGGESCATQGFPAYNTTVTHGLPPVGVSFDVYARPERGLATLVKVVGGLCGQAVVDEKSEAQVAKVAGLERGFCVARGYAEAAGSKAVDLPSVGKVQLALFRKAGELDLVDALRVSLTLLSAARVTLYKISGGLCGEATVDRKYEAPAEAFAGLSEGRCADRGYTQPSGSKDIHVPVLGDIKIAMYKQAGPPSEVVI